MKHTSPGRHAPAFVLLTLALGPNHGLGILHKIDKMVPKHRLDTAAIYRVLKKLESEAFIESIWMAGDSGPKKKVYNLTESGKEELKVYKKEIEFVINNLSIFVDVYETTLKK